MLPDWDTIQKSWPLAAAVAVAWARFEVAIRAMRDGGPQMEKELSRVDKDVEEIRADVKAQAQAVQAQAVQMGEIKQSLTWIGQTLERLDRKLQHFEAGQMTTVLYAIVEADLATLSVSSAGHPLPMMASPE